MLTRNQDDKTISISRGRRGRWIGALALLVLIPAILPGNARASTISYVVQALIDGRDHLIIQGNTLQWHHFDFAAVGRHNGANAPTIILGEMDGAATSQFWVPTWSLPLPDEIRFEDTSSVFSSLLPLFPTDGVPWTVTTQVGRGQVQIVQQPDSTNAHTLILEFDNNPYGSSMFYSVELAPVPEPTTALLLGVGICLCVAAGRGAEGRGVARRSQRMAKGRAGEPVAPRSASGA